MSQTEPTSKTMVQCRLFLHAETDQALLVSPSSLRATAETAGCWLPKSQVKETSRDEIPNPNAHQPAAAQLLGPVITFQAPAWLLKARGIECDAELAA